MDGLSTPEVVTIGAVALLVVKEAFAMVRANRQRNGHSRPEPASISKENAPEFWLLQSEIHRMIEEIRDEIFDPKVRSHHRD